MFHYTSDWETIGIIKYCGDNVTHYFLSYKSFLLVGLIGSEKCTYTTKILFHTLFHLNFSCSVYEELDASRMKILD